MLHRSLYWMQVYGPNQAHSVQKSLEVTSDVLRRVKSNESTNLSRDFNSLVASDAGIWKCISGQHGDTNENDSGRLLLQLCCYNAL